jgi:signal transduction histidine kinase
MGSVRLLNQTFRVYLLCSTAVLVVFAPVFYFSMLRLYTQDTDETLLLHKKEFVHDYLPTFRQTEIESWNKYNRDIKIERLKTTVTTDTFFYQYYLDVLDQENEPYRVLQSPVVIEGKPYTFTARLSLVETQDLIQSIAIVFLVLIGLLLAVMLFVTNRFSKKIWQPFHRSLDKLQSFDLTAQQTVVFDRPDIEEFKQLNACLQRLIDTNVSVYNRQKTFIENASHELQTPLAVLKSKINLLLQDSDITGGQSRLLTSIEQAAARMSRINKNLLLLAKIENNQFADQQSVQLTESIEETFELLTDYMESKQLSVEKKISQKLVLTCNKALLEILLNNLFVNAVVHNTEKGTMGVTFSGKTVTVSNTGKTPLNQNTLFERFAISSSQTTSSGLGLAIAKEICNRYGWQLDYGFENNQHVFSVKF